MVSPRLCEGAAPTTAGTDTITAAVSTDASAVDRKRMALLSQLGECRRRRFPAPFQAGRLDVLKNIQPWSKLRRLQDENSAAGTSGGRLRESGPVRPRAAGWH